MNFWYQKYNLTIAIVTNSRSYELSSAILLVCVYIFIFCLLLFVHAVIKILRDNGTLFWLEWNGQTSQSLPHSARFLVANAMWTKRRWYHGLYSPPCYASYAYLSAMKITPGNLCTYIYTCSLPPYRLSGKCVHIFKSKCVNAKLSPQTTTAQCGKN